MKPCLGIVAKLMLGLSVFAAAFAVDVNRDSSAGFSLVAGADARVGRPLTPMSYAGVARRTTYRAVAAPVAVRPVVVAPVPVVVVPPTCVDTVDVYGRVTRVCR